MADVRSPIFPLAASTTEATLSATSPNVPVTHDHAERNGAVSISASPATKPVMAPTTLDTLSLIASQLETIHAMAATNGPRKMASKSCQCELIQSHTADTMSTTVFQLPMIHASASPNGPSRMASSSGQWSAIQPKTVCAMLTIQSKAATTAVAIASTALRNHSTFWYAQMIPATRAAMAITTSMIGFASMMAFKM